MRRLAISCLLATAACATVPRDWESARIYSPAEVLGATEALEGQEILVRGWIAHCGRGEHICGIYSSRRTALGREGEWPLPIDFAQGRPPSRVREVTARGRYIITCRNTEQTICLEYNGHFEINSILD